ncbi:MAG: IS3 family transposase, partial [Methyloglobulus sp.]|nr:IS3 family transposase [Methyloglobulus sp.]
VYLYAYDSVKDAKHSIQKYLDWYNQERPHSNLNRLTPDEAYYGLLSPLKKAA